jgi:TolA-binding protein
VNRHLKFGERLTLHSFKSNAVHFFKARGLHPIDISHLAHHLDFETTRRHYVVPEEAERLRQLIDAGKVESLEEQIQKVQKQLKELRSKRKKKLQ